MENEQQNLRQATDDEAARQYSLQDAAEPLDGDHLDVDNPRRQQHALADKRTAPTESSSSGQHPTGTQSSGECESGVI